MGHQAQACNVFGWLWNSQIFHDWGFSQSASMKETLFLRIGCCKKSARSKQKAISLLKTKDLKVVVSDWRIS